MAYLKQERVRQTEELVDVFANEVRQTGLAEYTEGLKKTVKMAFVTHFHDYFSIELQ